MSDSHVFYCTWVLRSCFQLEKVELELSQTKLLHDSERRDFECQRDELLRSHAKQLAELKLATELEHARLVDDLSAQMELKLATKDREMSELRQTLQAEVSEVERRAKEQAETDAKVQ